MPGGPLDIPSASAPRPQQEQTLLLVADAGRLRHAAGLVGHRCCWVAQVIGNGWSISVDSVLVKADDGSCWSYYLKIRAYFLAGRHELRLASLHQSANQVRDIHGGNHLLQSPRMRLVERFDQQRHPLSSCIMCTPWGENNHECSNFAMESRGCIMAGKCI